MSQCNTVKVPRDQDSRLAPTTFDVQSGRFGIVPYASTAYFTGHYILCAQTELMVDSPFHVIILQFRSRDAEFGMGFNSLAPLEAGKTYRFRFSCYDPGQEARSLELLKADPTDAPRARLERECPDRVVINGRIVWQRDRDGIEKGAIAFSYTPETDGIAAFRFLKDAAITAALYAERTELPALLTMTFFQCSYSVEIEDATGQAATLATWTPPGDWKEWPSEKLYQYHPELAEDAPHPVPALPAGTPGTAALALMEFHNQYLPTLLPRINRTNLAHLVNQCHSSGVNGVHVGDHVEDVLEAIRSIPDCRIRHLWLSAQMGGKKLSDAAFLACAQAANRITEEFPQITVTLRFGEYNYYWRQVLELPEYRERARGLSQTERSRILPECHRDWLERNFTKRLTHPERVRLLVQCAGVERDGFDLLQGGFDVVLSKCIHRIPMNFVNAAARGLARASGTPMAVEYDPWTGHLFGVHTLEEFETALHQAYFSGADIIDSEATHVRLTEAEAIPNHYGAAYQRFGRFVSLHPRRGKPVVKIGLVRSDDTNRPGAVGGYVVPREDKPESARDCNLIDLFLKDYGEYWRGDHRRLFTGTPLGAVDILPGQLPPERYGDYRLLAFLGQNRIPAENIPALLAFVEAGGELVISAGQLVDQDRRLHHDAFRSLCGCVFRSWKPLPETEPTKLYPRTFRFYADLDAREADVLYAHQGQPMLVRHCLGRGSVTLAAPQWFNSLPELNVPLREHLSKLASPLAPQLTPPSDWIEPIVLARDGLVQLAVFNHGRLRVPSGLGADHGAWVGELRIDLSGLLPTPADCQVFTLDSGMEITRHPFALHERTLILNCQIDRFTEFVIGSEKEIFDIFRPQTIPSTGHQDLAKTAHQTGPS